MSHNHGAANPMSAKWAKEGNKLCAHIEYCLRSYTLKKKGSDFYKVAHSLAVHGCKRYPWDPNNIFAKSLTILSCSSCSSAKYVKLFNWLQPWIKFAFTRIYSFWLAILIFKITSVMSHSYILFQLLLQIKAPSKLNKDPSVRLNQCKNHPNMNGLCKVFKDTVY